MPSATSRGPKGGAGLVIRTSSPTVEQQLHPSPQHAPRRSSSSRSFFSRLVLLLLGCCLLCLGVALFHSMVLHETLQQQQQQYQKLELGGIIELPHGHGIRPVVRSDLRLASLDCKAYGGPYYPDDAAAREMVYWQEIPSDHEYKSPFFDRDGSGTVKYLTFEPDGGGWNNVRMAMETVLTLAHAMGRTLVLPPKQEMYLLQADAAKNHFDFGDFFPMDQISKEQRGMDIITMEEFLKREGLTGQLRNRQTGETSFPPLEQRTDWNGMSEEIDNILFPWLQSVTYMPDWNFDDCLAAFPATNDPYGYEELDNIWRNVSRTGIPQPESFIGKPTRVHANPIDRLSELLHSRQRLCIYNQTMASEPVIHFHGKRALGSRLLVHFYSALYFVDWKADLWTKRFIRDHVHYNDDIQCAAARIVEAVRARARQRDPENIHGLFDAFHVRRGDFQYKKTRVSAQEIYEVSKDEIPEGTTVYIATDERDKSFFRDTALHYDLVFLEDFVHLIDGMNNNYYGMIDQLVATRSRTFFGCWFSTFTGYINRIRGYHADRLKLPGFHLGLVESYYYTLSHFKYRMKEYWPLSGSLYARDFPIAWRNIDQGIGELPT